MFSDLVSLRYLVTTELGIFSAQFFFFLFLFPADNSSLFDLLLLKQFASLSLPIYSIDNIFSFMFHQRQHPIVEHEIVGYLSKVGPELVFRRRAEARRGLDRIDDNGSNSKF